MRTRLAILLILAAANANAAVHYIRSGATAENKFQIQITTSVSPQNFIFRLDNPSAFEIAWGDGSTNTYTYSGTSNLTHSYASAGTRTMKMSGVATMIDFYSYPGAGTPLLITAILTPIYGVTGLTTAEEMFKGCHNVPSFPTGLFDYQPGITRLYDTFLECVLPTNLPPRLLHQQTNVVNCYAICDQMEKLQSVDEDLFAYAPNNANLGWAFAKCYDLKSIPAGLYANQTKVTAFDYIHYRNFDLTNLPPMLFANCTSMTTLAYGFYQCTNLTGHTPTNAAGQKLWEITPARTGTACFYQCTNLSDYADIPAGWK